MSWMWTAKSHSVLAVNSVATSNMEAPLLQGNPAKEIKKGNRIKLKISIITVCYNSSKTLKTCIQSVVNQSYTICNTFVIDGESN